MVKSASRPKILTSPAVVAWLTNDCSNIGEGMNKKYGVVKRWMENGFGFLVSNGIERDIYFHARDWRSAESPVVGQRTMFELVDARIPGKPPQATNVHAIHEVLNVEAGIDALAVGLKGGE
jgi:cold shock CspA family protein